MFLISNITSVLNIQNAFDAFLHFIEGEPGLRPLQEVWGGTNL